MPDLNVEAEEANHWLAIWSLALGVAGLIIAEFLPAGLLTNMASNLEVSEGLAGQTVTVTSLFALIASLSSAYLTARFDRRSVLLLLSSGLTVSNLIVGLAPNLAVLLGGRALLGICLGGFWSMTTAVAARLVAPHQLPRALSIIFGSSSFAAVLAAPVGSYLGDIMGWRHVFVLSVPLSLMAWALQATSVPSLPPAAPVPLRTLLDVLRIKGIPAGLLAVVCVFGARFSSFTYLRPFLEQTHLFSAAWVSGALLLYDGGNFFGNLVAPRIIQRSLWTALWAPPLALACLSLMLGEVATTFQTTLMLLFVWGACFGSIPSGWSTWLARMAPHQAETAGGLYVAAVQVSGALGAVGGGVVFDAWGSRAVMGLSSLTWILSSCAVLMAFPEHMKAYRLKTA